MRHVVAEGVSAVNQNRVLAKDGSEFVVEWHGRPVSRSSGSDHCYVAMGIDITERQQMEEELAEARDRLEIKVEQRTAELLIMNEQLERQIHERQSTEEKLRSSEERYRQLTEYSLTGIYDRHLHTPEPTFCLCEHAACVDVGICTGRDGGGKHLGIRALRRPTNAIGYGSGKKTRERCGRTV